MLNIQAQKINSSNLEAQFNQSICIYRNETEVLQIVRISKPNVAFFERVVFPNQCIQFSAPIDALLEICEGSLSSLIHADLGNPTSLSFSLMTDFLPRTTSCRTCCLA
jgi:hypothetical protein